MMYSFPRTDPGRAPMMEDLTNLKDDMTAFIEGHGMRRFHGYVNDEIASIMWDLAGNADGWKDFVELAKHAGASFLTMNDVVLEKEDVEYLINHFRTSSYVSEEDVEEARWLRAYIGKTGFVQLGWPYQGTVFLCEVSTQWYERYQHLMEMADEYDLPFDQIEDEGEER